MSTDLVPYSLPDMGEIADAQDQSKSNNQWWRHAGKKPDYPGVFRFQFRCIPAPAGKPSIMEVYKHFYQLPSGAWIITFCPMYMKTGGKCFHCEQIPKVLSANPLDGDLADKMQPRQGFVFNVLLRNDLDRGPVIHESHWSWKKYADEQRKQGKNAFDPSPAGRDVIYQMPERDGERHEYKPMLDPTALGNPEEINDLISRAHDLFVNTRPLSYKDQEEAYQKALDRSSTGGSSSNRSQTTTQVVESRPVSTVRQVASRTLPARAAGPADDGPV